MTPLDGAIPGPERRGDSGDPAPYQSVAVVGGGAWGTALAVTAARAGRRTTVWARRREVAEAIDRDHRNPEYLGDIPLPESLRATDDLDAALDGAEAILLVTPSGSVREMAARLARIAPPTAPIIVCAKGIEPGTGLLMTDIVAEEAPGHAIGVLSGPTFADETARDFPTGVTIASNCGTWDEPAHTVAARMALTMGTESFRPYVSDDVTGVEIGGALKNVIAIACGIMQGAGFGSNTRAALITRGLDEMKKLADALGGRRETVTGLSGLGDLTLTCSSPQSRNFSYGEQLGRGVPRDEMFGGRKTVVEGVRNAVSVTDLARAKGVRLPICETVRAVVHDGAALGDAFAALWAGPLEAEPRALELELSHPAGEDAVANLARMMP